MIAIPCYDGKVNIKTGALAKGGTIWDVWPEDTSCPSCGHGGETGLSLIRFDDGRLRLVHNFFRSMKEGQTILYYDDQPPGSVFGYGKTIAVRPNTKKGLEELGKIADRRSLSAWVRK